MSNKLADSQDTDEPKQSEATKSLTDMVESRQITFIIGQWAQSWLQDSRALGAFSASRLRFDEQDRVGLIGKLRTLSTQLLEREIAKDKYPVTFSYKVPSSWWQHLKQDKAPNWFVRRYPVQYKNISVKRTVEFTRKATYPMADIVVPDNFGQVVIHDVVRPLNFYEDEL